MASLTLWQQSEVIRKQAFPIWAMKKYNVLLDFIKKGEVQQIGERDFRIPFQKTFGGRFGAYDPQMGDMGRGSQPTGNYLTGSYFSLRLNYELDMLALKATQDKKVALTDPFKDSVARGFYEFQLYWDMVAHSDGTALIATATDHSSSSGVSVYTLDTTFGANRVRRGQYVNVYAAALAGSPKSANTLYITGVNTTARTVTLSGIVPSAATTDTLTFEGVSGATPTGIRGLYYWNSYATSGTTAGIDRSTEPEILANYVDGTAGFTPEAVMALQHRALQRRGEVANGLLGIVAPVQEASVAANIMSIQNVYLTGDAKNLDRLPELKSKGKKSFMWGNIPHYVDVRQNATRADYIVPELWGRARLDEMKFFQTPGSNQRFFPLYGASGAPAAGVWFGLSCDEDIYNVDPGSGGVIYSLPVAGFYA